ncbi:DUF1178 family protein [Methylobacterium isbiliense]|jgi:hypothetical protein|uniref:Regulatory protein FmdB Zinc ribbon domain-containing protein n=1 Tax=Methylobacterium isbiliense TaxID=315478 RepID=A0ABQ4SCR9_9HYPH|nr:DUF1178 family protein [Methylobacterium isbiliense]MDN3621432.1 DUF1178 family protein [Methylobacterium isbiliense]GJE00932.1 hypothetical protein GMJLKIPL_2860 [Methylobacterium isbiliense]
MIRYALACEAGHEFESWFPSGDSYDAQAARGLVTCPHCDSPKVTKRIMAPALGRREAAPVPAPAAPQAAPEPVRLMSEPERQLRAMLKSLHEHVARTSDHVGPRFAEEARRMHYGEIESRSIYGEASLDDARALLEEGIAVQPLPPLPDERN